MVNLKGVGFVNLQGSGASDADAELKFGRTVTRVGVVIVWCAAVKLVALPQLPTDCHAHRQCRNASRDPTYIFQKHETLLARVLEAVF